jgi:hypothetical protein
MSRGFRDRILPWRSGKQVHGMRATTAGSRQCLNT